MPVAEQTPFVGRREQTDDLDRLIAAAADGRGTVVLIGGEPGIGKSRLALEALSRAGSAGFRCLVGHCYESEAQVPFAPLVHLAESASRNEAADSLRRALGEEASDIARIYPELRTSFPDLPPTVELPPGEDRRVLFDSITSLVARLSSTEPIMLVLEDVHHSDDATLTLIDHLTRRVGAMAAIVLCTFRDAEVRGSHPIAKMLQNRRGRALAAITLAPLEPADVRAMLGSLGGGPPPASVVAVVNAGTTGNPFFIEEVVKHLREQGRLFDESGGWRSDVDLGELEVPGSVRHAIRRRIEPLSEPAREFLAIASLIGRGVDPALLRELDLPNVPDAVAEAERAGLVSVDPKEGASFPHDLIRQTVEGDLPDPARRELHAKVGDALERANAGRIAEAAAELAHHFRSAGPEYASKTAGYSRAAGERALAAAAHEEALSHFEAALTYMPEEDLPDRALLLYLLGLTMQGLGDWDRALAEWDEALTIAERTKDADLAGQISTAVVTQLGWAGNWLEVVRFVGRGLTAVGQRSPHRALLLAIQGAIVAGAGDHATGAAMTDTAVSLAAERRDDRLLGRCLLAKSGRLLIGMRVAEALDVGEEGARHLRSAGALYDVAASIAPAIISAHLCGRPDRAAKLEEELGDLTTRFGHHGAMFALHTQRGFRAIAEGPDLGLYEQEAIAGDELCRRVRLTASLHVGPAQIALLRMWRGRWNEAVTLLREAIAVEPPGALSGSCAGLLVLALAYGGEDEALTRTLEELRPSMPAAGRVNGIGSWTILLGAVEALAVAGRRAESAAALPLIREAIEAGALFRQWDLRSLHTLAGIAARSGENWQEAEEHFRTALDQSERLPVRLEAAETRRFYAEMLVARGGKGDAALARRLAQEAAAVYERAGMRAHVAMTQELIDR